MVQQQMAIFSPIPLTKPPALNNTLKEFSYSCIREYDLTFGFTEYFKVLFCSFGCGIIKI